MIHAGIGETHMNAIFTTMGLPSISSKTLKKRERFIGPVIEETAQMSLQNACDEERIMTMSLLDYERTEENETAKEVHHSDETDQITFEEALALLEENEGISILKI